jgi:two-component system cell cycle sensor histidine kinase/response regulator CckA
VPRAASSSAFQAESYRLIVQEAPVAIALLDLEGVVLQVNPATERLLGYTREEILGRPWTPFTHPDDYATELPFLEALLRGEREGYQIEKRYIRKNGEHVWSRLSLRLVRTPDRSPSYLLALIEDITEPRRIQDEQLVLAEQQRQAQKLEAVGQLAGGIAHDFNNLLTVMMGHAGLALDVADAEVSGELQEILVAGERAADLVRQLLTFSRKQPIDARRLDLSDVVANSRRMLRRLVEESIEIVDDLWPDPLPVVADRGQLEQAMLNLALNARDAMRGGGVLTRRTRLGDDGQLALLSVEDNGEGMDAETRDRVFEPFYTTKDLGKGTGLGLAIVYGIVDRAGGSIRVESEPGKGTLFEIALPLVADAEAGVEGRLDDVGSPPGRGQRVLLIDDDAHVRVVTEEMLRSIGYDVIVVTRAEQAIAMAERGEPFDVLVTDLVMPDLTGTAIAEKLRALRPNLPVLFVSGYSKGTVDGVVDEHSGYLPKPFTRELLQQEIGVLLA